MPKILIIEDEPILADMYSDKFKKEGFEIVLAEDGRTGMETAKKEKPALILLDILLPRENGLEFLRRKNEEPELAGVPVIIFSNFDDPETKKETIALGAREYLIKSNHNPREIVEQIKKHLG